MRPRKTILMGACLAAILWPLRLSAIAGGDQSERGLALVEQQPPASRPPRAQPRRIVERRDRDRRDRRSPTKTGLLQNLKGAFEGYTLFAPMRSTTTYLIDMQGNVVHSWESDSLPGHAVYLLETGNLLRAERDDENRTFDGGGVGGRIREIDWDGSVVWEFVYSDEQHMQHHDIEPLPNGNVLLIAWERKSDDQGIAAGRNPATLGPGALWADHIVEVEPERPSGGTIVWEWHVWDHLIQDHDSGKANFGSVGDHPELIDLNAEVAPEQISPQERKRLEALGYMAPPRRPPVRYGRPDWNHINSIDYNPELDQIVLSVLGFNELWVIDHSTTTEEAAGHTGGKSGKGGDLLYRWGNPRAYRAGAVADQRFFAQHDAQWIPPGTPGAGNFLVFNNGRGRPEGGYSSVDEIVPPIDEQDRYAREAGAAFGPAEAAWVYTAPRKTSFHSGHISGAQRLPNGNTLICSGETGRFFEINPDEKIVWEYVNPFGGERPDHPPGRGPGPPPRHPGGVRQPGSSGPPPGSNDRPRNQPGTGGPVRNAVFRVTRLPPNHPGLADKGL